MLKEKRSDYIAVIIILFFGVLIFIRNLFGFDWSDETLYAVGPHRIMAGEQLFKDMWGSGAFGYILLSPILVIYKWIVGSMDGIMLCFRIIHNFINIVAALYTYRIFRCKGNKIIVLISCISIIVFSPGSIASLSYNTVSMQLLLISGLLICDYIYKEKTYKLFLSGISYGFAVQMYPGLIFAILVIPIYLLYNKKQYNIKSTWQKRSGIWVLGGILVIILFLCYIIYTSSIENMIHNFYKVFEPTIGEGYDNRNITGIGSLIVICKQYLIQIKGIILYNAYIILLFTVITVIYSFIYNICSPIVKKFLYVFIFLITLNILINIINVKSINYINLVLGLLGPSIWFINRRESNVCVMLYLLGIFESFAIQVGSNNGIAGSSYGFFISSVGVMLYLAMICKGKIVGNEEEAVVDKFIKFVIYLICMCIFASFAYLRVQQVYRDEPLQYLTSRLETGPGKGIYTTEESKVKYEGICDEIRQYVPQRGAVLFSKLLPFGYLMSDAYVAAPTSFRIAIDSEDLKRYYLEFPEKIPNCVFVIHEDVGITNEANNLSGYLGGILLSGEYDIIDLEYSRVYLRKGE